MGGHTGQWLLLAVLSAALCTPIMADPGHFEPEPAEVSAHHKRTAWPDVQEGEAGPSGRRRRKQKSPGQTKSPTRSPTKSPTRSPTKSPTLDPCDADFKSTPPTCPNGYSVTAGSLVDKQTKEHGVCIMIQSVLCQCGSSRCPKAECKHFSPVVSNHNGSFIGFEVDEGSLFVSNFTGWTATQPTAQTMPNVSRILELNYQIALQKRAQKIEACATESIQAAAQTPAATTLLTEVCRKATGLLCCNAPSLLAGGSPIRGSHQWEDTPTRCTLKNPLVQSFYSNAGTFGNVRDSRNAMTDRPEELTELKRKVNASLIAAFPGKQLALNVEGVGPMGIIVIGVGQRATTNRRMLGGFSDNSNLDGKAPGWHECEVKYLVTVSIMKNASTPQCVKNNRGGELCEPEMTASLTPWMLTEEVKLKRNPWTGQMVASVSKKLFRPNNNNQTCAQVDTALRKGLAAYRFGLKVRLDEKLALGEGIWSMTRSRSGHHLQHRCRARSASLITAKSQCSLLNESNGNLGADMSQHRWAWNGRTWSYQATNLR